MDFFELVAARESCRDYQSRPVEREKLERCIEAARLAPSACNSQPWHFTVAQGEKAAQVAPLLQGIGFNWFAGKCPAFIIINEEKATLSARLGGAVKNQEYAPIDIGIAVTHLCYAAVEQGLSTCIMGWFQEEKLKKLAHIAPDKRIRLVLAVGYAAQPELRKKSRKPLEEVVTYL